MLSFLNHCAEHLAQYTPQDLESTCVVLPTRRSGMVLQHFLKKKKNSSLPHITHIEDFISKMSGFNAPVQVLLLLELFEVFSEIDTQIKLEKFTGWGYILLKDFDLIDKNLIEPDKLFDYLTDIKNLERWKLGEERITSKVSDFFQLWENLSQTYHLFRERLFKQNQAYSGMMYRYLAENASSLLLQHPLYQRFVFIGFNALSKAEEEIFKILIEHQKAEIIWDADEYYMQESTENKAGLFLRKYKQNWASTNWKFQSNHLLQSQKNIQIIPVPNASMQGKVANQWLKNQLNVIPKKSENSLLPQTALVLADEHILLPVLYSLDEQFAGLNITIGLSLKDSAIFNLIDALFEQNQLTIRDKTTDTIKFNHRSVIKILNHPFIRQYERKNCQFENSDEKQESKSVILALIYYITWNNLIFIGREELINLVHSEGFVQRIEDPDVLIYCQKAIEVLRPLLEVLFTRWRNTYDILDNFTQLLDLLNYQENYLESAYLKEFQRILLQLRFFVEKNPKNIDIRTFKIFLYQAFREAKFDFDSDKDTALQLMGIVETRNLDFDNVLILSVNETVLPRSKKSNSFIPLDVCREFGLPTYHEQDAIVSYHFYRLLQRASQICLVYVTPSDTYGGKEKSRFILQLQNDLLSQNPQIRIQELPAKFKTIEEREEKPIVIPKDDRFIEKMKENFLNGLTPSQINSFVNCSLQYYFSQIAEIGKSLSIEENLGSDKQGSLIHEILEEIFGELSQEDNKITEEAIQHIIPSIEGRVDEKFNLEKYANYQITGQNYIVKRATTQMLESFLESQIEEIKSNAVPFEILTLENKESFSETNQRLSPTISASLSLEIQNEKIDLTIKGITDRIDKVDKKVRIIDYKTGKVESKHLTLSKNDLDNLVNDSKIDKVRQLWLYKYIIAKRVLESGGFQVGNYKIKPDEPISAGIYSLQNYQEGFLELKSKDKDASLFPETLKDYVKLSEEYLEKIIQNMLDKSKNFEKTPDLNTCKICAYKDICGR